MTQKLNLSFFRITITLFLVVGCFFHTYSQSVDQQVKAMQTARSQGQDSLYFDLALHLDSTIPQHPYFNLCVMESALLVGADSLACDQLQKRLSYNADIHTLKDTLLDAVSDLHCFTSLTRWSENLLNQKILSELIFEIPDSTVHPESVVYDPTTNTYYISSVRHRAIYTYKEGKITEFIPSADQGIGAVLGLSIDYENRILYATSAHIPEMMNYEMRNAFRNTLLKYHLDTGILIERNDIYDATQPRLLGEVKHTTDGTAFISDSYTPVILRWSKDNKVEEFIRIPTARSPQGLAIDESTGIIFIADYSTGIYAYDLFTGGFLYYQGQCDSLSLKGIDGLYLYENRLIAIQNGTYPNRIIELEISDEESVFQNVQVLENQMNFGGEPTNGFIRDGCLYYISNSPWPYYDEQQPDFSKFNRGAIRKLKLAE